MLDLKAFVDEKQNRSAEWKEGKQKERDEMNEMLTTGVELVTSDPDKFGQLMENMGNLSRYSAGNNILAMQQRDDLSDLGTMKFWNDRGRNVIKGESSIKIFSREFYDRHKQVQNINEQTGEVSTNNIHLRGRGYTVQYLFDVSQTQGKELPPKFHLEANTDKMGLAIKALIESTRAQVQVDNDMATPARYEQDVMVVYVREGAEDKVLFQSLATEVAHANIHDGGNNPTYQRANYKEIAEGIAYSVCVRYGVECQKPDFSKVHEVYEGLGHDDKLALLNNMQDMAKDIGSRIDKEIGENTQQRAPREQKKASFAR